MTDPRETHDDRGMISQPDYWPRWPYLPLKRSVPGQSWPDVGFVVSDSLKGPLPEPVTVYIGNVLERVKLADREQVVYPTIDSLVESGWIVD